MITEIKTLKDASNTFIFIDDVLISSQWTFLLNIVKHLGDGGKITKEVEEKIRDHTDVFYGNDITASILVRGIYDLLTLEDLAEFLPDDWDMICTSITSKMVTGSVTGEVAVDNSHLVHIHPHENDILKANTKLDSMPYYEAMYKIEKRIDSGEPVTVVIANPDIIRTLIYKFENKITIVTPMNFAYRKLTELGAEEHAGYGNYSFCEIW